MVDGEPWVHLNAIGRPYNKEPNQWLKSETAKEYVDAVELLDKQTDSDPAGEIKEKKALSVQNGGKNPGTCCLGIRSMVRSSICGMVQPNLG